MNHGESKKSRLVAHVDMNSYFASVEQQANPFLRGRAVGVCAYLHRYGCVIAASVEAKQMGMRVGMTMEEAKETVPSAVFVQNEPSKYRAVTSRIFSIFHEMTDAVEHYSIDEAFLDLTGWYRDAAEAGFAFSRVKHRIRDEVGEWLRCSVGIAPTRFLAKFASDLKKPDGLTVLTPENLEETFAIADLEDAWGIGPRYRRRLEGLGIKTLLDLKHYPVENLLAVLGKPGYFLWAHVNGIEIGTGGFEAHSPPKTIGHSYCVPNRVNHDKTVEAILTRLTERAGRRLRKYGLLAGAVTVVVGFRHGGGFSDHFRFSEAVHDSFSLVSAVARLLHSRWDGESVDFLAVTLSDFSVPTGQMDMMADRCIRGASHPGTHSRAPLLAFSLDRIRDRHGEEAIVYGRMFKILGRDDAPDRIGFRKTSGAGWEDAGTRGY